MKRFNGMTADRLGELLGAFTGLRIAVLGDFFLDKYLDVDPALAEYSIETGKTAHQVVAIRKSPGAAGTVGPSLKNLKNRPRIAGGVLENTDENLREWLKNPKSVKPNTMMPDTGLEDSEIEILLKFFDTL